MWGEPDMRDQKLHDRFDRVLLIGLALIPACMGIFAFLNNLSGWEETVLRMVYPMISMQETFGNPAQTWRAIDSMLFANVVYAVIFVIEGIFGLLALYGAVSMIRKHGQPDDGFTNGIRIVKTACMLAVLVYGLFFFTIGGDWFLAWQSPNLIALQKDAVNYGVVIILVYIILDAHSRRA